MAPKGTLRREDTVIQKSGDSHTFIARFWLEPREIKDAKPIWRGVVEHVATGRRRYLEDLDEIKTIITGYLHKTE